MATESELRKARYSTTEKEADDMGRVIAVRRLRLSQQTKINGMTEELTGFDEIKGPDGGEAVRLSHRVPLIIAASVCEIDGVEIPFPRNRGELDAIYDRLDTEGVAAAGRALVRLQQREPSEAEKKDEAKNLSGTPPSA